MAQHYWPSSLPPGLLLPRRPSDDGAGDDAQSGQPHMGSTEPNPWEDEFGFPSKQRVLLFDATGSGLSDRAQTLSTCSTTSAYGDADDHRGGSNCADPESWLTLVSPALQGRVRHFTEDADVREVLLLSGGIQAFLARYSFLSDGVALHPELGSHFYPSHVIPPSATKRGGAVNVYRAS